MPIAILPRRDRIGKRIGRRQGRTDAEKAAAQSERIAQLMHSTWLETVGKMLAELPEGRREAVAKRCVPWGELHPSTRKSLIARAEKVLEDLYRLEKASPMVEVPDDVRVNARRVIEWREEHGKEVRGMTRVGWTRARQLAEDKEVSLDVVSRMAQFKRHRKNAAVKPAFEKTPWKDAGHVAWLGWGGDEGILRWAPRVLADAKKADVPKAEPGDAPALEIEIRDQYRATALRRLPDPDLIAAHDDLHQRFAKRPEGTTAERFVNAHVAVLQILAERNLSHPEPPKDSGELDTITAELQRTARGDRKTKSSAPIDRSAVDLSRAVDVEEAVEALADEARIVPVYLSGDVVDSPTGTPGDLDVTIARWETLPEWLRLSLEYSIARSCAPDLADRWAVSGGPVPPGSHVIVGHIGYLPVEDDLEVVTRSIEPEEIGEGQIAIPFEQTEPNRKAADDPYLEYPAKPTPQLAVVQVHAIGTGRHIDLRAQLNPDELIGWSIFAGRKGSADEPAETIADVRDLVRGWTSERGNGAVKPIRGGKSRAAPKPTHPTEWLGVQGVMDPGEAGATVDLPGVFVALAGPDKLTVTWGAQKDGFHEYFIEVDGDDPHDLAGVWSFQQIEGTSRDATDEGEHGRSPSNDRAWIATIEDAALPYVLSPRAVKEGWLPPPGQHALPSAIAAAVPEGLRYWTSTGEDAKKKRDELVESGVLGEDAIVVASGQFRTKKTTPAGADAEGARLGGSGSPGSPDLPVLLPVAKAWLGERRPDGSRLLKAVVYAPFEIDAHGDWTGPEQLLDASIYYAIHGLRLNLEHDRICRYCGKNSGMKTAPTTCPHCGKPWRAKVAPADEAMVAHNYTADVTFEIEDLNGKRQVVPRDSWIVAALLRGDTLEAAEAGKINGWSFEGLARSAAVK